jgi:hypothetical protein
MCALTRKHIRLNNAELGISTRRGPRKQAGHHIIGRGIRNCRTFVYLGKTIHTSRNRQIPVELHATKGWRYVTAWS